MLLWHNIILMTSTSLESLLRPAQRALVAAGLFFIYIFGFGITYVLVSIFNRKLLGAGPAGKEQESFWTDAQDYQADASKCLREV